MEERNETNEQRPQDLRAQLEQALAEQDEAPAAAEGAAQTAEAAQADAPAAETETGTQAESPVSPDESPVSQNPEVPGNANQTGMPSMETLTQVMNRTNAVLQQLQQENAQLREQVQQQSQAAEQRMEQVEQQKTIPMPDMSQWAYMTDAQRAEANSKYMQDVAAYFRGQMDAELAPIRQRFEEQTREAARASAIDSLSSSDRLPGFRDELPRIQSVLEKTPELGSSDPARAYQIAYLINRGAQSLNQASARSAAQIAEEAMKDPEVMRIIESRRAADVQDKNANVPVMAASSGMAQAAAAPTNRPKTLAEAHKMLEGTHF